MNGRDPPRPDGQESETSDAKLLRVLDDYLVESDAGRAVDPASLVAAHPEIADELRACLEVIGLADRIVDAIGDDDSSSRVLPRGLTPSPAERSEVVMQSLDLLAMGRPTADPRSSTDVDLTVSLSTLMRTYFDSPRRKQPPGEPSGAPIEGRTAVGGRYRILDQIGAGGMGLVHRARDEALGRELAIKVLRDRLGSGPDHVRRFLEEARIHSQLQHPGIVPLHDFGQLDDERPFFAMRLVEGRTLAQWLRDRASPGQDRPQLLGVFAQVCQTLAYAHSRGVIHRDLKPSNIMVGAFGEVLIMDWGVAKILGTPEDDDHSIVESRWNSTATSLTHTGALVGTLAYMAPEQVRGKRSEIDARTDVFGLGGILCEILTGAAPFDPASSLEQRARDPELALRPARERLVGCDADPELIALATSCLAANQEDRPAEAGAVAGAIERHLNGVQDRLQAAELAKAEAQARAVQERERRRLSLALAVSVILTLLVIAGGWEWMARQRARRRATTTAAVNGALEKAILLQGQARATPTGNLPLLTEAQALVGQARVTLATGEADPAATARVQKLDEELKSARIAAQQADKDRAMVERLEAIRTSGSEHAQLDEELIVRQYATAFHDYGVDLDKLDQREAGSLIAARPAQVAIDIAAALDDWAWIVRRRRAPEADWRRIDEVARAAAPDPWRTSLRDQAHHPDRVKLIRLAEDPNLASEPVPNIILLADTLRNLDGVDREDFERSRAVLLAGWASHPEDPWINHELGLITDQFHLQRGEESVRYRTATVACRPRSVMLRNALGVALRDQRRYDEAIAEFDAAMRLDPSDHEAHVNRALALLMQGKPEEAVAEWRLGLRARPDAGWIHANLAKSLSELGMLDESVAEYREAVHLEPRDASFHRGLGYALILRGRHAEGIAECRSAVEQAPDDPDVHNMLAWCLAISPASSPADREEARLEARRAIQLGDRVDPARYNTLGVIEAYRRNGRAAIDALRVAMKQQAGMEAYNGFPLAIAIGQLGREAEANATYDGAVAWTREYRPREPALRLLWARAAETLGRPGPEASPTVSRIMPNGPAAFAR